MDTTPETNFNPFVNQAYDQPALTQFASEVAEWSEVYIKRYARDHGLPATFEGALDAIICLNQLLFEDPATHLGGDAQGQYYVSLAEQCGETIKSLADLHQIPGTVIDKPKFMEEQEEPK